MNIKLNRYLSVLAIIIGGLILTGCPEEDEGLVNPEPVTNTVGIRVLNLSRADQPISFRFDSELEMGPIGFGELTNLSSPPDIPPYDSLIFEVLDLSGDVIFTPPVRPRLFRNINYTYIILPSRSTDSIQAEVGRLLVSQSAPSFREDDRDTYLKVLNGIDKDGISVVLRDGCPSGDEILRSAVFGIPSAQKGIAEGERTVSVTIEQEGESQAIGTYNIDVERRKQSMILVTEDMSSPTGYRVGIFDEEDELSQITSLEPVEENTLSIRLLNLADDNLSASFNSNANAFGDVNPYSVSNYRVFGACQTVYPDTVRYTVGPDTDTLPNLYTFNVGQNYTIVNYPDDRDSTFTENNQIIINPIPITYQKQPGFATVRVFNAIPDDIGITLSIASNSLQIPAMIGELGENVLERNYVAGNAIASSLTFGSLSPASNIAPGSLPLALLTAANPASFISGYIAEFEADKDYVVYIYGDKEDPKLSVIAEDMDGGELQEPVKGSILQVVNADPGVEPANITITSATGYQPIEGAKIAFTNTLSTIVPLGDVVININGTVLSSTVGLLNRVVAIADPSGGQIHQMAKMDFEGRLFGMRLINSAPGIENLTVVADDLENTPIFDPLPYGFYSAPVYWDGARSYVFYAFNGNDRLLSTTSDIPLDHFKAYYLIFAESGGIPDPTLPEDEQPDEYTIIVTQEF